MKYAVRSLLLSVFAVAVLSCDKATPTAPGGSTLAITANPSRIGLNGSSLITIIGRQPNGSAMREGTEIRLSATLGTIDPLVLIDSSGNATATFRSDGRRGAATVTAQTGTVSGGGGGGGGAAGGGGTAGGGGGSSGPSSGSLSVQTSVQVGEVDETRPTLLVNANPSVIPVEGTSRITVIGRNSDGTPVGAGQTVVLTTTLGNLNPNRPTTDANGTATSTLRVGGQPGTATVTAVLGTSEPKTVDVEIRGASLSLTATPTSVNEEQITRVLLEALVSNFQGGPIQGAPVTFRAEEGTVVEVGTNQPAGIIRTSANGVAAAELIVDADSVDVNRTFQVTATTPSGSGEDLTATVTITIRNLD